MRTFRELLFVAVFMAAILWHQATHRTKGLTYVGRHRVHGDELTTMQQVASARAATHAELVHIDINQRGTEVLPKRTPGDTLLGTPWFPPVVMERRVPGANLGPIDDAPAHVEVTSTKELERLRDHLVGKGVVLRPAAPEHGDVTDEGLVRVA